MSCSLSTSQNGIVSASMFSLSKKKIKATKCTASVHNRGKNFNVIKLALLLKRRVKLFFHSLTKYKATCALKATESQEWKEKARIALKKIIFFKIVSPIIIFIIIRNI